MRTDCRAYARPIALNEVEYAGRNACRVKDLGKDGRIGGALFGRLQNHRVARRQRRCNLQRDLIERPVPRGNHADNADRLVSDLVGAVVFHEVEVLERSHRAQKSADSRADLCRAGEADRSAHFLGHRNGKVGCALLELGDDAIHQGKALFTRGLAEGLERTLCSGHCLVDIGLRP